MAETFIAGVILVAVCASMADSRGAAEWVALAGSLAGAGIIGLASIGQGRQTKRKRAFAPRLQSKYTKRLGRSQRQLVS
ncbi:hypothetical protein GFC01_15390 [Desulfofundulus thermobenzoicus]|uniref:Uncharacterized protein n=1 Tax=Desulfofundulus thermobenzoicus TaxID=29376 RepID=A0A6N7IUP6_9FIRM|nr:hypothetical protein [Desulfofundulus thermobenzoicus]MQL53621.1 hypothetical protein [Desulfofundulus thermobenzoicus]